MTTRNVLREALAAHQHRIWANWQDWVQKRSARISIDGGVAGQKIADGLVLDSADVARWNRQIATPYHELTEAEKDGDREQVDRFWSLIEPSVRCEAALESAANEGRHVLPSANDDEAAVIEEWAFAHLQPLHEKLDALLCALNDQEAPMHKRGFVQGFTAHDLSPFLAPQKPEPPR